MQHNSYRRWITLAIVVLAAALVSTWLIYVIFIKFPWRNLWDSAIPDRFNNEYLWYCGYYSLCTPSGVIADKFSHRKMITSAMIITGLLGLLMATYPPLWVMLCIQVAFAITTILMLWSVSIKAASLLGDHSEQGKIMGWMEAARRRCNVAGGVYHVGLFSLCTG